MVKLPPASCGASFARHCPVLVSSVAGTLVVWPVVESVTAKDTWQGKMFVYVASVDMNKNNTINSCRFVMHVVDREQLKAPSMTTRGRSEREEVLAPHRRSRNPRGGIWEERAVNNRRCRGPLQHGVIRENPGEVNDSGRWWWWHSTRFDLPTLWRASVRKPFFCGEGCVVDVQTYTNHEHNNDGSYNSIV